jgi:hypothetical protein
MLYLLDANVPITANNLYYPINAVPEFWTWLEHRGAAGLLKMPLEIFEEIREGGNADQDLLYTWVQDDAHKAAILLDEKVAADLVTRVLERGYAADLTDEEIEQIGRDPFLIAYALASPADRCVVTTEVSSPGRQRQNRRIPDVCQSLGVTCCDNFAMFRALGFSTNWRR